MSTSCMKTYTADRKDKGETKVNKIHTLCSGVRHSSKDTAEWQVMKTKWEPDGPEMV